MNNPGNTDTEVQALPGSESVKALLHSKLSISGMHCAACNQIIEFRLKKLSGVRKCTINVTTHTADISWTPKEISLPEIIESISSLGYGALPLGSAGELINREHKMSVWRLFVAGFAMMQVMMYALPAYLEPIPQIDGDLTPDIDRLLKIASLAITLPVVIFSSWPFFQAAIRDIRNRNVGMDIPVSVGIIVTFIASVWATFAGGAVYYDSLIMFVFLLLAARLIQSRVHNKSTSALRVLTQLLPLQAERLPDYPANMRAEQINASQLLVGDTVFVQPGSQIPVDGIVISGTSECDESLMTGESRAVSKSAGASLIGGSQNLNRPLIMRAVRVGDDTQLSSLVRMMESAASEKPPLVQLADRYASLFLTVILLLAIASGIVWWQIDAARAVWIAVTVMVITCPCALSLATPGVMSAAIGQMAKQGVLIARGRAIETLARATHFVFDKTGTLTQGRLKLVQMLVIRNDTLFNVQSVRALAADITAGSNHPVARALFTAFSAQSLSIGQIITHYDDVNEIPGLGIEVRHQGLHYRLGSIAFVRELHGADFEIPVHLAGKTLSVLGDKHGYIALFALEDTLRNDAKYLIDFLQQQGKTVLLLSGDRSDVVSKAAAELGISTALGNLSPEAKHDTVKHLQQQGAIVAMVGDGMNDGPVLSLADVSIAMGQGAPISQARSDMVLISNDLRDLVYAVQTTSKSLSLIRQNLAWALLYNVIAIPAAMAGILAPWHAAIGMSLSSIIVVVNSLRIYSIRNETKPGESITRDEEHNKLIIINQPS
ncbi:MAG TPA: cation-translocating P-type ATPase [Gallionellaceae bacterium]|nr:cation-translocating P-type ATPase [Gallionellaceae bacterium]